MSEIANLTAEKRERAGKGAARADRRAGRVPGVIYGAKKEPVMVTFEPGDLDRAIYRPGFFATLFDIKIGTGKERVLPRDIQFHPITDRPIHVDFLRVSGATELNVNVPVHFIDEEDSPGLKRGGVLNVVRHEIELYCRADNIPQHLECSLAGLDINDSIHMSAIELPDGVRPTITDRDFTVATVAAPSAVKAEAAEEQAEAEAEVTEAEEMEAEEAEGEEAEAAEGEEETKEE
jgi:large subunit ribosomal protein L25